MVLLSFLISSSIFAEDTKVSNDNTKFNIYSGMFDFSDNGKRSTLIGFQHQNTDLNRDTFLGNLSPITGFMFILKINMEIGFFMIQDSVKIPIFFGYYLY